MLEAKGHFSRIFEETPTFEPKKPTMNWVHQCFEGIDLIVHKVNHETKYVFVRLDDFAKKVLSLLGNDYVLRYSEKMLV